MRRGPTFHRATVWGHHLRGVFVGNAVADDFKKTPRGARLRGNGRSGCPPLDQELPYRPRGTGKDWEVAEPGPAATRGRDSATYKTWKEKLYWGKIGRFRPKCGVKIDLLSARRTEEFSGQKKSINPEEIWKNLQGKKLGEL